MLADPDVAGSSEGSFMDVAAASGYQVVSFDRPGYGGSSDLAPADNTFGRHVELLAPAIAQAAKQFSAASVLLVGHSIGGMIALMIGHSIDHHILGHALHLRQLAFAEECALWARQEGAGS